MTCIGVFVLMLVGVRRRMSAEVVQDPPSTEWAPWRPIFLPFTNPLTPFVHKKINETLFFLFFLDQGAVAAFCPCPFIPCLFPRQPEVLITVEHPLQSILPRLG